MIFRKTSLTPYSPGLKVEGAIKLSSNENPLGTSPLAIRAIADSLALNPCELHIYPPVVPEELQTAIAQWRGAAPSQVICANGSDEIFTLASACLIEAGSNAIGSSHSFSQYRYAVELFGGEFREVPTSSGAFGLAVDVESIVRSVDAQTAMVFLCSPNNPTGLAIPEAALRWALSAIPDRVLVVIDQAYADYADVQGAGESEGAFFDATDLISEYPNLIVTGTFSKIFGLAALRIGYGLADESIIQALHSVKSPFNTSIVAQRAALAAIGDSEFYRASRAMNSESKRIMQDGLNRLGIEYIRGQGNFICLRNPPGMDIARVLHENSITVRRLASFGLPNWLRITIPQQETAVRILRILAKYAGESDSL